MLTNSKTVLSLSLALGIAAAGLIGSANAGQLTQGEYLTIQDNGNRDSNGSAPVYGNGHAAQVNGGAASAFAAVAPSRSHSQRVAQPESFRIQSQGNRDSNGY
jgi:hypothetical protein